MTPSEIENTPWAKRFLDECPSDYQQALEYAYQKPLRVKVSHNNDTGQWRWSIVAYVNGELTDFWMDSFKSRGEAVDLCIEMGWEILEG
jgi:hypothetical protein